jgi:hypothetical protein
MKIEQLKAGQTVWDVQRRKMGNTAMRTLSVFAVVIHSVHLDGKTPCVMASWNGNPPSLRFMRDAKNWRKSKPVLIRNAMGRARLATREELKEMKASQIARHES